MLPGPLARIPGAVLYLLLGLLLLWLPGLPAEPAPDAGPNSFWFATAADGSPMVRLHFFWSETCPHCREALPFVRALPERLPWLELVSHQIHGNEANTRLYVQAARMIGREASSVPGFMFCDRLETGYRDAETTGAYLVRELKACHERQLAGEAGPAPDLIANGKARTARPPLELPLLGTVDPAQWSLPLLTLVLAGLDAFNPCAFFVLLFLLSLLVGARSRARMALVGGVFVLISGLVYFAFMAAWLNLFLLAGELRGVTLAAGAVAILIGLLNTKDFFRFRQGPSLSISDAARPRLFRRMRDVVGAGGLGPMLAGTVLLAIVANSYELLCTAGFPMVFTRALTLNDLGPLGYYGYLALYNLIYVVPLAVIVGVFTWGMGRHKLSEREGRGLKLISGLMMLGLGALLLLAPEQLTNSLAAIGVLALALLAALVILRLTGNNAQGSGT